MLLFMGCIFWFIMVPYAFIRALPYCTYETIHFRERKAYQFLFSHFRKVYDMDRNEIVDFLKEHYSLTDEKAELLYKKVCLYRRIDEHGHIFKRY